MREDKDLIIRKLIKENNQLKEKNQRLLDQNEKLQKKYDRCHDALAESEIKNGSLSEEVLKLKAKVNYFMKVYGDD